MILRPPRSTLFPLRDALPIWSRRLCLERELGDVLVRVHQEQAELHAARGEYAEAFAVHKEFFIAHNALQDRKSTRLNSSHAYISYAVFCLKKNQRLPNPVLHP